MRTTNEQNFKSLQNQINELKLEVERLKNPPKFKEGDEVSYNLGYSKGEIIGLKGYQNNTKNFYYYIRNSKTNKIEEILSNNIGLKLI